MVELEHLTVCYGDRKALDDVSVLFPHGKLTVILGPNGSGKTTLIKTALGLLKSKSGKILIDGKNIDTIKLKEIAKKVSYLSQSRNIPSITAEKMVLHGRFPYIGWPRNYSDRDRQIVLESMRRTDCEYIGKRIMTDLSGGERQKVYLAMVLAQNADTIFMDEPTTYLDPENQISVMNRARELCNSGKTVVMVLHDLSLALRNADQILVMKNGCLEKKGSVEDIYRSGILEKVFHVKVGRAETATGFHYWTEEQKV